MEAGPELDGRRRVSGRIWLAVRRLEARSCTSVHKSAKITVYDRFVFLTIPFELVGGLICRAQIRAFTYQGARGVKAVQAIAHRKGGGTRQ